MDAPPHAIRCPNCGRYLGSVTGAKNESAEFAPCARCGLQTQVRATKPLTGAERNPTVAMETT